MKYSLRNLMIVAILAPPVLAGGMKIAARLLAKSEPSVLPISFGINDDVQYFPPGPEFKLSREAAAMRARKEDEERTRQAFCPLQP